MGRADGAALNSAGSSEGSRALRDGAPINTLSLGTLA